MLDKIKGALFGLAIGDALGGTTEFLTKDQIVRKYGKLTTIIGGGWWDLEKGETTDDTAMTIAVAKGLIRNPEDLTKAIGDEFLAWRNTRPKDIGNIIATVFGIYDGDWPAAAKTAHYGHLYELSAGNGTLMRCLPVALAYSETNKVEEVTRSQSRMTHYDGLADEACVIYNRIAHNVLHGGDLKESIKKEITGTRYEHVLGKIKPQCKQSGYVVDTLEWVLYWLLTSESYSEAVTGAANEGNDTDTVAAIAGGLAGLACGYEALPKEYVSCLLNKDELNDISDGLHRLWKDTRIK